MDLRDRVLRRLAELNQSPFTLAKSVGLHRQYINDIVVGRKEKLLNPTKRKLVARALQCDEGYLTGAQPVPRMTAEPAGFAVAGVCQTGIWRDPETPPDYPRIFPAAPDTRFPLVPQVAFLLRGYRCIADAPELMMGLICIERDVYVANYQGLRDGLIVVVNRKKNGLIETSLRQIEKGPPDHLRSVEWDNAAPQPPIEIGQNNDFQGGEIVAIGVSGINFLI